MDSLSFSFEDASPAFPDSSDAAASTGSSFAAPSPAGAAPEAVNRLIADEIPFLQRQVRRWQRDPAEADDLVQETLARALSSAHSWQPGSDLRGWLYTIMRNQFYASANSAARRRALADEPAGEEASDAEAAHRRLELRDVQGALGRLPLKQRLAILLVAVEGKSYEEGARAMEMSVDAVRCHLARGRQRLRELVDGSGHRAPLLAAGMGRRPVLAPLRRR
jgi:RNA polymerase sigma-70 factor (ECF subfamily)